MRQSYDCIFIGLQPAGLISAALLAHRGYNVAILQHGAPPGCYNENGWKFPFVPALTPNLSQSNFVRTIHDELGIRSLFQSQSIRLRSK